MGDIGDAEVGRDVEHHRVADADELVGVAVIGEERDERTTKLPVAPHPPATGERYPACV